MRSRSRSDRKRMPKITSFQNKNKNPPFISKSSNNHKVKDKANLKSEI